MTVTGSSEASNLEVIARQYCERLLNSGAAKLLPPAQRDALIIIAFTFGAAWALDAPDMVALGNAQIESLRSLKS